MNRLKLTVFVIATAIFGMKASIIPHPEKVQTEALQAAIDSISESGGGVLRLSEGDYVTGTLALKDNVTVCLDGGARILGSLNPYDYAGYAVAGQDDNRMADKCSVKLMGLIVAEGIHNIGLTGHGTIDGRGLEVALAIDSLHHIGERIDPAYNTRRMRPSIRPKLIDFEQVDGAVIEDVSLRASAAWGLSLNNSNNIKVCGIRFVNRAYWNNDGIDIADCHNVLVERCDINSADDGIVLKSFNPDGGNENITIRDCDIRSSANALKIGTETFGYVRNVNISNIRIRDTFRSALAVETVDGAEVENIRVDSIDARNTGNAIFMRLGHRRGDAPGCLRDVYVSNLNCEIPFGRPDENYDLRGPDINIIHNPFPNSITGIPGHRIENVRLENITVSHPGRGSKGMAYIGKYRIKNVPEEIASYPEFHMFGELPAWGFYIRHVNGIRFDNVKLILRGSDYRDAVVTDDVVDMAGEAVIQKL